MISVAHAKRYVINNQHSFLSFEIKYMIVSKIKGNFEEFSGYFDFNENTNRISNVVVEIVVSSLNTHNKIRDSHLLGKLFFNSKKHSKIKFIGQKIIYNGEIPIKITGLLEYQKKQYPHSFDLEYNSLRKDAWPANRKSLFLTAKTTLDRRKIGLIWNKKLESGGYVIGNLVQIELIIEANSVDKRHPFSRFFLPVKTIKWPTN